MFKKGVHHLRRSHIGDRHGVTGRNPTLWLKVAVANTGKLVSIHHDRTILLEWFQNARATVHTHTPVRTLSLMKDVGEGTRESNSRTSLVGSST